MSLAANALIRSLVRELEPYVPGEQPRIPGLVKLNTNENPYPPSPKVLEAVRNAVDARLRLYPNPTAEGLRVRLAELHGCSPENVIVGNGSDELLALAVRAFVDPVPAANSTVQFFHPSYSLYPVLAAIHGAACNPVALGPEFSLPSVESLRQGGRWLFDCPLTFITTPNAPSGRGYRTEALEELCQAQRGVVVLDEAYVDFAVEHAMELALNHRHVMVSRTFSKAYSLCFQRVGYFVGNPDLIVAMHKIRDSYNVNGLGQVAAEATLDDQDYYQNNFRRIVHTRETLSCELRQLGFAVLPSQTNFVMAKPPVFTAEQWLEKLRERRILVRWFKQPDVRDYLRVTIGTDEEAQTLVKAARSITG